MVLIEGEGGLTVCISRCPGNIAGVLLRFISYMPGMKFYSPKNKLTLRMTTKISRTTSKAELEQKKEKCLPSNRKSTSPCCTLNVRRNSGALEMLCQIQSDLEEAGLIISI